MADQTTPNTGASSPIGTLRIPISVDMDALRAGLLQAQAAAESSGDKIADAIGNKATPPVKTASEHVKTLSDNMSELGSRMQASASSISLIGGALGGLGLIQVAKGLLDVAQNAENVQRGMSRLAMSVQDGTGLFAFTVEESRKAAIPIRDLEEGALRIQTLFQGNVQITKAWLPILMDVAAAARSVTGGKADFDATLRAVSLMGQFGSAGMRGPELKPLRNLFLGTNENLSGADAMQRLLERATDPEGQIMGAAASGMNSLTGNINQLKNEWEILQEDLMKGGAFAEVLRQVSMLTTAMRDNSAEIEATATAMAPFATQLVEIGAAALAAKVAIDLLAYAFGGLLKSAGWLLGMGAGGEAGMTGLARGLMADATMVLGWGAIGGDPTGKPYPKIPPMLSIGTGGVTWNGLTNNNNAGPTDTDIDRMEKQMGIEQGEVSAEDQMEVKLREIKSHWDDILKGLGMLPDKEDAAGKALEKLVDTGKKLHEQLQAGLPLALAGYPEQAMAAGDAMAKLAESLKALSAAGFANDKDDKQMLGAALWDHVKGWSASAIDTMIGMVEKADPIIAEFLKQDRAAASAKKMWEDIGKAVEGFAKVASEEYAKMTKAGDKLAGRDQRTQLGEDIAGFGYGLANDRYSKAEQTTGQYEAFSQMQRMAEETARIKKELKEIDPAFSAAFGKDNEAELAQFVKDLQAQHPELQSSIDLLVEWQKQASSKEAWEQFDKTTNAIGNLSGKVGQLGTVFHGAQKEIGLIQTTLKLTETGMKLFEAVSKIAATEVRLDWESALGVFGLILEAISQIASLFMSFGSSGEKTITNMDKAVKELSDSIDQMGQKFTETLVDMVRQGTADWADLTDYILDELTRIAIQYSITEPLIGVIKGFGKSLFYADGGVIGGGLQMFGGGGILSSPMVFPMANGMGLVGEAGPEAIMPVARGADGKLGVSASGIGGGNVTVEVYNLPGQTAQVTRSSDGAGGAQRLRIAILDTVRAGAATGELDATQAQFFGTPRVPGVRR